MKWDIRKKIFAFMLAGSIFCLLSFCVLLLSQFLSLNRHISEKTSEMQTSVCHRICGKFCPGAYAKQIGRHD